MKTLALAALILSFTPGTGGAEPQELCVVSVPASIKPAQLSPDGETNGLRYTTAFKSYCWNCVAVRAQALDAACPMLCSGDQAATLGCAHGATAAEASVAALIRQRGTQQARKNLRALASEALAKHKLDPYFKNGPSPAPK